MEVWPEATLSVALSPPAVVCVLCIFSLGLCLPAPLRSERQANTCPFSLWLGSLH